MHRALYVLAPAALTVALAAGFTVGDAVSSPATAEATASQYTVTQTLGPFRGDLAVGATVPAWCGLSHVGPKTCITPEAGAVPGGQYPFAVWCHNSHDALLDGNAVVNLKTTHGTTSNAVLNLDRVGAVVNEDDDPASIEWGTWIHSTGKPGWNSVTITATCLIRR